MLITMEAVMCLKAGARLVDVSALMRHHHVQAQAMHPGVADEALARWYVLAGPSDSVLAAAVHALQVHPAVDAALIKPAGEAPR